MNKENVFSLERINSVKIVSKTGISQGIINHSYTILKIYLSFKNELYR